MSKKILVTGAAGFIGFHTILRILGKFSNAKVVGVDSLNNYYDVKIKKDRVKYLRRVFSNRFIFKKIDISNEKKIFHIFRKNNFHTVINLAAQAGVRYSLKNPKAYFDTNLKGFFNIIENCRINNIKHLISASTSSVYGINHLTKFKAKSPAKTSNSILCSNQEKQ